MNITISYCIQNKNNLEFLNIGKDKQFLMSGSTAIDYVLHEIKDDLKIVYIWTPDKERLLHILNREENPDCKEVCRRFLSDKMDYVDNNKLIKACKYVIINEYTNKFYDSIEYCAENAFEGD